VNPRRKATETQRTERENGTTGPDGNVDEDVDVRKPKGAEIGALLMGSG
jgi:hypothetical protein